MAKLPAIIPLSEADYDLIESAVMETVRGRWFLAEYARRNRHADTTILLAAIGRLQAALQGERTIPTVDWLRLDFVEMANVIARVKPEIAALTTDRVGTEAEALCAMVEESETAGSKILHAAERIEELVWKLREQGLEADLCDLLDAKVREICRACGERHLGRQRTSKLIAALHDLDVRVSAMLDGWDRGARGAEPTDVLGMDPNLGGPTRALSSSQIEPAGSARFAAKTGGELAAGAPARFQQKWDGNGLDSGSNGAVLLSSSCTHQQTRGGQAAAKRASRPAPTIESAAQIDAMNWLEGLSEEEKIALFS